MEQKLLWRCDDNVFSDETMDGIFLLSEDGEIFVIDDPVGKFLWNQLASNKCSLDMLIERTKEKFTGGDNEVAKDVDSFVEALADAKLIISKRETK